MAIRPTARRMSAPGKAVHSRAVFFIVAPDRLDAMMMLLRKGGRHKFPASAANLRRSSAPARTSPDKRGRTIPLSVRRTPGL